MRRRDADLARVVALAAVHAHFAAILEIAVVRHVDGVRHLAGDGVELVDLTAHDRLGGHEADGVGVRGMGEDLLRRALLDDALAHTAGELVREHLVNALAVGNADHFKELNGARLDLRFVVALFVVQGQHLVDLVADAEHGVQRGHRLLEDHGDIVAA